MRRSHHSAQTCGSGLARDGINAVWLKDRRVCIAGKPTPTGYAALAPFGTHRWERACPRWHQRGLAETPQRQYRRQASSHRVCGARTIRHIPVGAGLPAMASTRFGWQTAASASQASQLLQGMRRSHYSAHSCGSVLARDGINAVWLKDRSVSIAGKPAPTGHAALAPFGTHRWERACPRWHQRGLAERPQRLHRRQARSYRVCGARTIRHTSVGAGLPAMESTRFGWQPAASASQASQLPQGMRRSHHSAHSCGSGLARDGINAVWLVDRSVCRPINGFAANAQTGFCTHRRYAHPAT